MVKLKRKSEDYAKIIRRRCISTADV